MKGQRNSSFAENKQTKKQWVFSLEKSEFECFRVVNGEAKGRPMKERIYK